MSAVDVAGAQPASRRAGSGFAAVLAMVALADILMFGRAPGINVFVFAIAVAGCLLLFGRRRVTAGQALVALSAVALAAAPLAEAFSLSGLVVAMVALAALALSRAGLFPRRIVRLPEALGRYGIAMLARLPRQVFSLPKRMTRPGGLEVRRIKVWIMPLGLAACFLALFSSANPVIEAALNAIDLTLLFDFLKTTRIALWLVVAVTLVMLLRPHVLHLARRPVARVTAVLSGPDTSLFGRAALLRALVVFNILFLLQTGLDIAYLWGGVALPDGMTYAQYAHRGAYPLVATALLAAAFVLVAMRPGGPGIGDRLIRGLVHLWVGQNVLLCVSSILRLDLYVEVYSLTGLRIAAGIWMGLVALGLVLIMLRIAFDRSNQWLVAMSAAALVATLHVSAMTDFASVIARFNVTHSREMSGAGVWLDTEYLLSLGPSALPAIDLFIAADPEPWTGKAAWLRRMRPVRARQVCARAGDWRSWTFRQHRLEAYLRETAMIAGQSGIDEKGRPYYGTDHDALYSCRR